MRSDLVYPELSYKITGLLFDVYNQLGPGLKEGVYQNAVAVAFKAAGIKFEEQVYSPLSYSGKVVGKNFFDFLVEGCVILELKRGDHFAKTHIDQLYQYLKSKNLKLGILAYFAPTKVHYKRIVNL